MVFCCHSAMPCCWYAMGLSGMLFGNLQIFQDWQTYCSYSTSLEVINQGSILLGQVCHLAYFPGWWLVCWLNKTNFMDSWFWWCTVTTASLGISVSYQTSFHLNPCIPTTRHCRGFFSANRRPYQRKVHFICTLIQIQMDSKHLSYPFRCEN